MTTVIKKETPTFQHVTNLTHIHVENLEIARYCTCCISQADRISYANVVISARFAVLSFKSNTNRSLMR